MDERRNAFDRLTDAIDWLSVWSGKTVAWLIYPMFLVLAYEVVIRKIWQPTVWANDIATICYGTHFMIAGAYTLYLQKHIRTDFLSQKWSLRTQVVMDLVQYILFFMPGMLMFAWLSWNYAAESWALNESMMTTWRPPAYWFKTVIPVSTALILIQGVSEVLKCIKTLRTGIDYRHTETASELT
jgi:TRAP-type mannitol/chloroaromatic compound transport system permease small subunit